MKLREAINNNTEEFIGMTYEDNQKIIVRKFDNANWLCTSETFEFDTINDYENWKREQKWIKKVKKVSDFKSVKED